ncbi:TetR/AcrR family transcriptional regulator [Sphingobium sp. YBL2]|uniref:TetR/AcrR family transcriptional regulator n=1 Tax=Sphingobium sp. (strain YBL2) TaxID=484429 RepID=UPI0006968036|nr:TetR family transcriptional regulator [Sphingobium sp. YBL2]
MARMRSETAQEGQDTERKIRILDSAEKLFAATGFNDTSLRSIARSAQVDLALIGHHFGSKVNLFNAVLARRADLVHHDRLETLEHCRSRAKGAPPIEELVQAFFEPLFARAIRDQDWRNYLKLVAKLSVQREWAGALGRLYNPTAKYFVNAMRMTYPQSTDERLYWAYQFLLGGMVYTGADCGRINGLSGQIVRSDDFETAYRNLIVFVSAGVHAILRQSDFSIDSRKDKEISR